MQAPSPSGGRFGRALRLVGTGFTMARDEPGLMAVPAVSFVIQVVVVGVAILLIRPGIVSGSASSGSSNSFGASGSSASGTSSLSGAQWVVIVVAGVLVMFVSVVSHATIIARVMARFHGRRVSNAKAAGAAMTKSPQLLLWAFINYVVNSLLRSIADRGILGWLVGSLLRAGWLIASFFVVPVILFENRGAFAAVKRSVELCRSRWGENVVGNSALAVIGVGAVLADVAVSVVLGLVFAPLGMVVGVLGFIGILLVLTVASAAFNAALYWYAVTGQAPGAYSVGDMQSAYRERSRRTGIYGF